MVATEARVVSATAFLCGDSMCLDGKPHDDEGRVEFTRPCPRCDAIKADHACRVCHGAGDYVCGGSVTCSRCGVSAMDRSLLEEA
jgi:hypothetical protein